MGGELFKKVPTISQLKKKDFKQIDRKPYTYGDQPFKLVAWIDLDLSFNNKAICTLV